MNPKKRHLFIFAGEHSGDLHGGHLLKSLKQQIPAAFFSGVGGPLIRSEGIQPVLNMEDFQVMGFGDVLKALPKLLKQFVTVKSHILEAKPEAVILVDYPGFNLRLAKALKNSGYAGKIIQYISPTVWAWGQGRAKKMARNTDLLLTIYPFEPSYFVNIPLKVQYVGNPLQEYIKNYKYQDDWKGTCGIPTSSPLIAIFPGSRPAEISRNLPLQLEVIEKHLKINPERIFAISAATDSISQTIVNLISNTNLVLNRNIFLVPKRYTYELMRDSRTAIAKSGTVTLELALHKKPSVITYKLTPLNRFIGKYILGLKLPHYCIVNVLSDKRAFPELIEHGLNAENLLLHLSEMDHDTPIRRQCLEDCQKLDSILGDKPASYNAAKAIVEEIGC